MLANINSSSCECPAYPNWMWRYNRNKHLTKFEPWFTRVERWPPHYRNMGVGDHFRFAPLSLEEEKNGFWQPGLSYAKNLNEARHTGSGNSALGLTPGPAPPRFIYSEVVPHQISEVLRVNHIEGISEGASLHNHSSIPAQDHSEPLNPRQYLQYTLGQRMEYPGTFPHINGPPPKRSLGGDSCSIKKGGSTGNDPLSYYLDYYHRREEANAIQKSVLPHPYPEYCCEEGWEPERIPCRYS